MIEIVWQEMGLVVDGVQQYRLVDAAYAKGKLGVEIVRLKEGLKGYRISNIILGTGASVSQQRMIPVMSGVPFAFYWPDAPREVVGPLPGLNRAYIQPTESNGEVGFALNMGSYIQDVSMGGPHAVWVHMDSGNGVIASDVITKLGMLGGTEHYTLRYVDWYLDDSETEPPVENQVGDAHNILMRKAYRRLNIAYTPNFALQQFAKVNNLGMPADNEFEMLINGTVYVAQTYAMGVIAVERGHYDEVFRVRPTEG